MKITVPNSLALAKNFSKPKRGSVRFMPLTLVQISTPRMPSFLTQYSSSLTASSAFCKGTEPKPTKRSGCLATNSAMPWFTSRASSAPSLGSVK